MDEFYTMTYNKCALETTMHHLLHEVNTIDGFIGQNLKKESLSIKQLAKK